MTTNGRGGNFWTTFPGILTGVAGLITAIAGLVIALNQTGVVGDKESTSPTQSTTTESSPAASNPAGADAIAGTWSGTAAEPDGKDAFSVDLDVAAPCRLNKPCGTIHVSSVPCTGRITLAGIESKTYEFSVDKFTDDSGSDCKPGGGEYFTLLDDGSLRYTPDYLDSVVGILHKTG